MPTSSRSVRALAGLAACLPVILLAAPARALDTGAERALRLAGEGRCAAALPELDAARAARPDPATDARLALRAGQCRTRLHRYDEAVRDLVDATRLAPESGEAQLALLRASVLARDRARAHAALDAAERLLPDDAEVAFYRGMLQLEEGDDAAAIASLERALALDPERVEPVASQQIARARERLQQAERRHVWLDLGAGIEHDTNVVLRGSGVPEPADISDDRDQRGVWLANAGAELWKGERATLGAMASYRGTTHFDLHEFDAHFPSATTWLDLELGERMLANARYDVGYAWLDGDPFVLTNAWQLSLQRAFRERSQSRLRVRTHVDRYFYDSDDVPDAGPGFPPCGALLVCGPPGLDERSERRRSGWGLEAGVDHGFEVDTGALPVQGLTLRGGYAFGLFEARGREYSHTAHTLHADVAAELPFQVLAEISGAFTWRPYRHPSTYPDPPLPANGSPYVLSGADRRERTLDLQAALSRALTEQVSVSARYRYVDNQSNRDVFDYEQQVFGLYLNLSLAREL